jgi:hypothetical protein
MAAARPRRPSSDPTFPIAARSPVRHWHLARRGDRCTEGRVQRALQGRTIAGLDPITRAEQASIPILWFVDDHDTRTPAFHARDVHKAVRDAVPSRFELLVDMPHSEPWYYRHPQAIDALIEDVLGSECFDRGEP